MASITFVVPSVLNPGGEGEAKLQIDAESLADAFGKAAEIRGADFARRVLEPDGKTPRQLINVYVNGKNSKFSGGMDMQLHDGDEVYILPAVAGGCAEIVDAQTSGADTAAAVELTPNELERFSRQVMLEEIGYNGQLRLKQAKVCVVGSGGLGNPIATRLVSMGIGTLRIIDRDVVETSNLHRQTLFDNGDVGQVKVEAAARKLQKLNPECRIEPLPISVNSLNAGEAIAGCDVVIDALDSVNARYALNEACIASETPFVTGAAVGVTGQVFTVMPHTSACYFCIFPELDEDSMPTCSIEGVHPSILSVVGGIEVAEAVKVIMGKKPSLSERILHIDLEDMAFNNTRTFRVPECPVCGHGSKKATDDACAHITEDVPEPMLEELCGRNRGKRTFAVTPPAHVEIDVSAITDAARRRGFLVENLGDLGISMRTNELSVNVMSKGSAVIVGPKDEADALALYKELGIIPVGRA